MDCGLTGIDYLGFDRVLRRGTGEILAESEDVLLLRDNVSKAYFLACDDTEAGMEALDRCAGGDLDLLSTPDLAAGEAACERYGLTEKLECYQAAYYGDMPETDDRLSVRIAEKEDLPVLTEHYDLISEEELAWNVDRGAVIMGYCQDELIGFIGEHNEGSIGMLYVFPEYRNRGFAAALEKYMFRKTMEEGFIPFGQVVKDNEPSLELQKKLGLTISENLILWAWK